MIPIQVGAFVSCKEWIGVVQDIQYILTITFNDGSICTVTKLDENELESMFRAANKETPLYPGRKIRPKHSSFWNKALWTQGTYKPKIHKEGTVTEVGILFYEVEWIHCCAHGEIRQPPSNVSPNELESTQFRTYLGLAIGDYCFLEPKMTEFYSRKCEPKWNDPVIHNTESYRMQIKSGLNFAQKSDRKTTKNSKHEKKKLRKQMRKNLRHSKNCVQIVAARSFVDVKLQDGSILQRLASYKLIEKEFLDDLILPDDYVLRDSKHPNDYGVVKYVDSKERMCSVRWIEKDCTEEVSLYNIQQHPDMEFSIGCSVTKIENDANGPFLGMLLRIIDGMLEIGWTDDSITLEKPIDIQELEEYDDSEEEEEHEEESDPSYNYDNPHLCVLRNSLLDIDESEIDESQSTSFHVAEEAPDLHHYYNESNQLANSLVQVIMKEWLLLQSSLPDGTWVFVFEDRIDLLSAMIKGAIYTPYNLNLFLFDFHLSERYPFIPPKAFYHSLVPKMNPNLYEDGNICLSLLGTWNGEGVEVWNPLSSNVLQLVASIQGLILGETYPYFLEAGYDKLRGTTEGIRSAKLYNEKALLLSLQSMVHLIKNPPSLFQDLVYDHFKRNKHIILNTIQAFLIAKTEGIEAGKAIADTSHFGVSLDDGLPSHGFLISLEQISTGLIEAFASM